MSFALSLAADVVEADAGATTPVGLTIVNRGAATELYEVQVEGIDPEWVGIPVPTFTVEPGESRSEKAFLKPPRLPESVAGSYPFVVRVRSLESGEARTAQGLLKLKAFHSLTMEIAPKKGVVSPTTKRNDFRLALVNLGNSEQTLQLTAQDPEDRCAFEFESDQVVLGPGQQREVEMVADPKQTPLLSSGRLIGFSVFARSLNERNVAATVQAQLEQRSLLSPTSIAVGLVALAAVGGWWTMRPQPSSISLSVNPAHALRGEKIQVAYLAKNVDHVKVEMDDATEWEGPPNAEPLELPLKGAGFARIHIVATRDGRTVAEDEKRVQVDEPVPVPAPKIQSFKASETQVKVGTSFVLNWKVTDATKLEVTPTPMGSFTPERESLEVVAPATPGDQVYTLIATNAENVSKKQTVKVHFFQESDAKILDFSANATTAKEDDGGKVTLSWQDTGAVRTELKVGSNNPIKVDDSSAGYDVNVGAKTTFTLIATDANGLRTTRKVTVNYEKKEIVVDPSGGATPPSNDPSFPDKVPPISTPPR